MGVLSKLFGKRVKTPELKQIDADAEIRKGIDVAIENAGRAAEAAAAVGESSVDAALARLERISPGAGDILRDLASNVRSGLRGELPEDVNRLVRDTANSRAFSQGAAFDSGFRRNTTLRDLGLTSLDRIDRAINQGQQVLASFNNFMGPQVNASSFFLTPSQRLNFIQSERNAKFNRDASAAIAEAQADPRFAAVGSVVSKVAGPAIGMGLGKLGVPGFNPETGEMETKNTIF